MGLRGLGAAVAALCAAVALLPATAGATDLSGAIVNENECNANQIPRNDDGSSQRVDMPFPVDFYGQRYDQLWVNNNGNVTFDDALSEYTPFGLKATSRAIIAPFFADVDTRGVGSNTVKYGWGETTYLGQPAFCVNWIDVGYYNAHADKLNSFQLLLVDRSELGEGDFDIVFNYGSITWETGDASGGSGGFGGSSARVGFSNGDGTDANSYELSGSGINGTLLDSNTSRGLIHTNNVGSPMDGRYVFRIRNGIPAPSTYVAMGDSYQSGEGAGDYESGTDIDGVNQCHRSDNAYPRELVRRGVVDFDLDFVACSGAEMPHLIDNALSTTRPPWNEGAQFDNLDESTALATLGIGGNDLGFGPTLAECITGHYFGDSCEDVFGDRIQDRFDELRAHGLDGLNAFQRTYDDARTRAWRSRMLVLGYPRFFPREGGEDWTGGPFGHRCQSLRVSDQIWINFRIHELNSELEKAARSMGAQFVNIEDVPDGEELCSGADPTFMNGVVPRTQVESFHPNAHGHDLIANAVGAAFDAPPAPDEEHTILPEQVIEFFEDIEDDWFGGGFGIDWPGSDVELTLISPSGKVYSRGSVPAGVYHRNGPTQELYRIPNPEKGRWTVRLYGRDVSPRGERVRFNFYGEERPNQNPVTGIKITKTSKNTIRAQATGAFDPDGSVVDYLWDFGDGYVETGPDVTHRFAESGSYRVTLVVRDDRDGLGFATADTRFELVPYAFSGFKAPVEDRPVVNAVKAGSAVPVKFSLGGPQGLTIFDAGFPKAQKIDCQTGAEVNEVTSTVTAGGSTLSYDAITDTYTYVWKTDKGWAGSCRRLALGLNDSSSRSADFRLK